MNFAYFSPEDCRLSSLLPPIRFWQGETNLESDQLPRYPNLQELVIHRQTPEYSFLHEVAIIGYHHTLFSAWYNCTRYELQGTTLIRSRRSSDGGQTWGEAETIVSDPTAKILYSPPVYGICDDTLYMLVNEMVGPDLIHAIDLFRFDLSDQRFHFVWSRPIPFKLNTNVRHLANGKLMLPGRIAEPDGFPNTPAVLISDSGKIDAPWRLVKISENGTLPDGSSLVHPEISPIIKDHHIWMFCRNDQRNVPLVYHSEDFGEHWSAPMTHNLPLSNSKIYTGTLSDGRNYLIGNLYPRRERLTIFFSEPHSLAFRRGYLLQNGENTSLNLRPEWSYPCAWEEDGKLYVAYTSWKKNAVLSILPL